MDNYAWGKLILTIIILSITVRRLSIVMRFPTFSFANTFFQSGKKFRPPAHNSRQTRSVASLSTSVKLTGKRASASKILCVGDIHSQWDEGDERALIALNPDLVLFVGDYGDEDVKTTRRISDFALTAPFGVATVFGNHDAFFTASSRGRQNAPYNIATTCRVSQQLEHLKEFDASYRSLTFDNTRLSVCGGRSFSWGGPNWKYTQFYRRFFGITGMRHSTSKLEEAVVNSSHDSIVFLSHSGPIGLGDQPSDPCGKDWGSEPGGDYGDADLRSAIETARSIGKHVPLVVFGHMHQPLQGNFGMRTMMKVEYYGEEQHKTVMLNAAVTPRHRMGVRSNNKLHHFQIVFLGENGDVSKVEEAWVTITGTIEKSITLFEESDRTEAIAI